VITCIQRLRRRFSTNSETRLDDNVRSQNPSNASSSLSRPSRSKLSRGWSTTFESQNPRVASKNSSRSWSPFRELNVASAHHRATVKLVMIPEPCLQRTSSCPNGHGRHSNALIRQRKQTRGIWIAVYGIEIQVGKMEGLWRNSTPQGQVGPNSTRLRRCPISPCRM